MLPIWPPAPLITNDTWMCLLSLMTSYFKYPTVEVFVSDQTITSLLSVPLWTFYVTTKWDFPKRPELVNTVMFAHNRSFEEVELWGKYNKVVIVTEDLSSITPLWVRSRLIDLVVLLSTHNGVYAYTWFPYKPQCHRVPELEVIGICTLNHTWATDLYVNKVPRRFHWCPVYFQTHPWPPDIRQLSTVTFAGREVTMMNILAESLHLTPTYLPTDFSFFNWDLSNSSYMGRIRRGYLDIGFCTMTLIEFHHRYVDSLPTYRDQPIVWMFPLPKPKNRAAGIYSGFDDRTWATVTAVMVAAAIISLGFFVAEKRSIFSWHWFDFIAIAVAMPSTMKPSRTLQKFILLTQIYSLHVTWIYQSTLLYNLYRVPMEKQIKSAQDAIDAGLKAYITSWLQSYMEHDEKWSIILKNGRYESSLSPDFEEIVTKKTGFILVNLVNTGFEMRRKYGGRVTDMAYVHKYVTNHVTAYGAKGSPITKKIHSQMAHFIASGIFSHLTRMEPGLDDPPLASHKTNANRPTPLTFETFQVAFLLLACMSIMSLIVFLGEHFINRWGESIKRAFLCQGPKHMKRTKKPRLQKAL